MAHNCNWIKLYKSLLVAVQSKVMGLLSYLRLFYFLNFFDLCVSMFSDSSSRCRDLDFSV